VTVRTNDKMEKPHAHRCRVYKDTIHEVKMQQLLTVGKKTVVYTQNLTFGELWSSI